MLCQPSRQLAWTPPQVVRGQEVHQATDLVDDETVLGQVE
jgi:hypothetical protein